MFDTSFLCVRRCQRLKASQVIFHAVAFVLAVVLATPRDGGSLSTVDPVSGRQRSPFMTRSATIGASCILDCDLSRQAVFALRDVAEKSGKVGNLLSAEHILTWRRQGKEVPIFIQFNGYPPHIDEQYLGRVRMVEPASIEVSDLRLHDEGWYECSVVSMEDEQSTVNGSWIYLAVNAPPVLGDVTPSFLIHKEGDTVELFCEATGSPEPVSAWHKDDREIISTDRITVRETRIQIRTVVRADGGAYTCTFKNNVGHVSYTIKLVIEGEGWVSSGNAYIMVPPKNTTVVEGSRVKLNCQSEGHPNNITYRWYRNGFDTQHITGLTSRASIYADGSLVISTAARDDSGWYSCRPTNGVGPAPEAQAYLNITYVPRVHGLPVRVYLPRGLAGRIDCPTDGNPPMNMVTWSKNERIIDATSSSPATTMRFKVNRQGSLIIRPVEVGDEGRYTCTPYSSLGVGHQSMPVQVLVREPPHLSIRPNIVYQRQVNQSVVMPCQAQGDPLPTITWKKVKGTFPTAKVMMDAGNLTIMNIAKEDQGTYECIATNVVANVVGTTQLIVEMTSTHAAYNISVEMTSSSARLSWLPAFDSGYLQHYVIWYRSIGNPGKPRSDTALRNQEPWLTLRVVPRDSLSMVVYRLRPSTSYIFMILARNRLGDGLFSQPINATTLAGELRSWGMMSPQQPAAPNSHVTDSQRDNPSTYYIVSEPRPQPPFNVTAQWQRSGVRISWLPASSATPALGGDIPPNDDYPLSTSLRHYIQYRTVGHWVPLVDVAANVTSYDWTTASRGATYHFRLISGSGEDMLSEPSAEVIIRTTDPQKEGFVVTSAMIGATLGGLLLVFFAVVSTVVIVKFFINRKRREKSIRFGNVKYFGPNHSGDQQNGGSRAPDAMMSVNSIMTDLDPIIPGNNIGEKTHVKQQSTSGEHKHIKETPI